jgi:hypothetical protein
MRHLYEIAVKHKCTRVEWTTDSGNLDAQRFYAELGVPVNESKLFYRVEGEELRQVARALTVPRVRNAAGHRRPGSTRL